ncbi:MULTISPECIES: tryptophan 7-halogenase [unclassified Sphingomonas]|uniref:tryptophan halogenase family protein n=1 Tax=unclassified Sphingomonas TaxID=196159 RepID=UPI00285B3E4D|nr:MULTISPECIES: tryptophan 7-halogenase [unclassified Sphingomonas]MDR6113202.1 tryptophan halogenase [Sphingomonas sp. SORGH_AS_0789]MDR6149437.1 tryptophan halogenase [Sphingomonas sp. SORGH_AS_0742]
MTPSPIEHVVIVGGGTAGWMMAAAAGRYLDNGRRRITLVESDAIGTVGVGEATIPSILNFNALLGIDEAEFLRATQGSFKLGIAFTGWHRPDSHYIHPFGHHGRDIQGLNFHQLWLKMQGQPGVGPIGDYSASTVAMERAAFGKPLPDPRSPLSGLAYAYHFDAGLYAAFLRRRAEADGVARVEGRIVAVERHENGDVAGVRLEDGRRIAGDLFVDCSGFRSLLLGDTLGVPFEDWSHWLPCDRAIAVPTERTEPLLPYTRATAHEAGWQWRIPLQHRTGNGVVYASRFMDDDAAERLLLSRLDAAPTATPRRLSFTAGCRQRLWERNVVALGLAGGFLEPLESTSIHLIQQGISKLFALFPDKRLSPVERDEYNRQMGDNYRSIRDFIILHYHATARDDSPFWDHVRTMALPDTLPRKIALFREKGRIFRYEDELFATPSWVAVLLGQGVMPQGYDPVIDALDDDRVLAALRQMRQATATAVAGLPPHAVALARIVAGQG